MTYRALGRTGLSASVVGFGTCQLRLLPEQQALDTLQRGFELGVNLVHTAPDYEGADELVAEAVRASGRDVLVLTQGYGDAAHFEWLFETACRRLGRRRLEMYGIACIDDREFIGENVWGPGGQVQYLLDRKREGRLGGIFCTTHGTPEYVARLVTSGVFDAIMLSYNSLGFHLLSYHAEPPRSFEDVRRNGAEIFPLAARHGVGLLVMKPLAGGLLCDGRALPPRTRLARASATTRAADVLRSILTHPEVTSVVPGTCSVAEAEENARAGHGPLGLSPALQAGLAAAVDEMKATLCSRCGACEPLCSRHLPVSWLFRDAYINIHPSETFETQDHKRYFQLHPDETATCRTCTDVTCACPAGLDIPARLAEVHDVMLDLRTRGLLPTTPVPLSADAGRGPLRAVVVRSEAPAALRPGERATFRLWVHNGGEHTWGAPRSPSSSPEVVLAMLDGTGQLRRQVPVRHDVEPGTRTHFALEIEAPPRPGLYDLRFVLAPWAGGLVAHGLTELLVVPLRVSTPPEAPPGA